MSKAIKPTAIPSAEEALRLATAITTIALTNELSVNWKRVITEVWGRVRTAILDRETAQQSALGILALRLSQAGANACATAAEETTGWKQYYWMRAGHAHREASAAIMVGWPPQRPVDQSIPTEFANLQLQTNKPMISTGGNQYLQTLIHDPIGIPSKADALAALEVIASSTYLDGLP